MIEMGISLKRIRDNDISNSNEINDDAIPLKVIYSSVRNTLNEFSIQLKTVQ